ncbi:MAG: hypothetical protein PXY39_05470 [archaeon]|nr:hypothetical protein [archaeon]
MSKSKDQRDQNIVIFTIKNTRHNKSSQLENTDVISSFQTLMTKLSNGPSGASSAKGNQAKDN